MSQPWNRAKDCQHTGPQHLHGAPSETIHHNNTCTQYVSRIHYTSARHYSMSSSTQQINIMQDNNKT